MSNKYLKRSGKQRVRYRIIKYTYKSNTFKVKFELPLQDQDIITLEFLSAILCQLYFNDASRNENSNGQYICN